MQPTITEGIPVLGIPRILATILAESSEPATRTLERCSGQRVSVELRDRGGRPLTDAEHARFDAGELRMCRWRTGRLVTPAGITAAETTLVWLPTRIPAEACSALEGAVEPAGVILSAYGMRRADRIAVARSEDEAEDPRIAVKSSAVLRIGGRSVAIATEHVTSEFCGCLA